MDDLGLLHMVSLSFLVLFPETTRKRKTILQMGLSVMMMMSESQTGELQTGAWTYQSVVI
jgi:hypothetical protein